MYTTMVIKNSNNLDNNKPIIKEYNNTHGFMIVFFRFAKHSPLIAIN